MKPNNKVKGFSLFLAGFFAAMVLQFIYPPPQDALADQYACIRTDLDARGMTGNIPDSEFTITYTVPSCYGNQGYTVEKVYMHQNEVAVHYKSSKTNPISKNSAFYSEGSLDYIP